jgi:hypothetical protein
MIISALDIGASVADVTGVGVVGGSGRSGGGFIKGSTGGGGGRSGADVVGGDSSGADGGGGSEGGS